jgi:phosphorylcholine metabolism protein LicD
MVDKIWDFIVDASMAFFLPLVCSYFALSSSLFLNVACEDAGGLENFGNQCLAPLHYLCMGRTAKKMADGRWEFSPRFDYTHNFGARTVGAAFGVLPGLVIGAAAKTAALLDPAARVRYGEMASALRDTECRPNKDYYQSLGITFTEFDQAEAIVPEGYQRRPGDERALSTEKEALRAITALLSKAKIPWWVDCGTCLGAYRYGGAIPWDEDVDIAVLLPDFDNVCRVLNQLDPQKYIVQDWSSRDHPKCYLKVFIRESRTLIDIYHFAIHPEARQLTYVLSLEHSMFFPEWWKIRERRFTVPVAIDTVFPLKRASFDGIDVYVPNDTKKYLQRYYGENLAPAKVYDPITDAYEKDLSHPYWQRAYVH